MEKNRFEAPLMEVILFDASDIITGSNCPSDSGGEGCVDLYGDGTGNCTEDETQQ